MENRIGKILLDSLINSVDEKPEKGGIEKLIEETKTISSLLQTRFSKFDFNESNIIGIFDYIISGLKQNKNAAIQIEKSFYILLDYIKIELFFNKKGLSNKLITYINDINIKPYLLKYIDINTKKIYNKNIEPYKEISYLFFLLGMGENFDIISDIKNDKLEMLKTFLNTKVNGISKKTSSLDIDEFCLTMNVLNQLTIFLSINAEDKAFGLELFNKLLIKKTRNAIKKYIHSIDKKILSSSDINKNICFSNFLEGKIRNEQLIELNKIQDILGKFYYNFASSLEYIPTNSFNSSNLEEKSNIINNKFADILDIISYGYLLRESAKFGNKAGEEFEKSKKESRITTDGNIAFTKLIKIKKLESIGIKDDDFLLIKYNSLKDIIKIYNQITGDKSKNKATEILEHFINDNNPKYNQIIIVYKLLLFCDFESKLIQEVTNHLIKIKSPSTLFEKFKIKTIELVLEKLSSINYICNEVECIKNNCNDYDKKICNKLINLIENYINDSGKDNMVYNYGKLYLSLANIYSLIQDDKSIKKAKKYLIIFQDKYGNNLPNELELIIKRIESNIGKYELENYNVHNSLENGKEYMKIKEHNILESKIFELIHEIKKKRWENNNNKDNIQTEICELISNIIFNNLCKISIHKKGTIPSTSKLEKSSLIEGEYLSIIFTYNSEYENSFLIIFNQEKDYIKDRILQLISINEDYIEKSQDSSTIIQLVGEVIEQKDTYTKGHITSVKELSGIIGEILGMNINELEKISTKAMIHDYGKIFIPDEILKKSGIYSQEERDIINSHTGKGVIEGIKNNWNIAYIEGMVHHCNFYSPDGDKNLTLDILVKKAKEGKNISLNDFNKILGNNIPLASRIIMIPDIIDAIASRRIYDYRASWNISDILTFIDNELLKCSGLKRCEGRIYINEEYWQETNEGNINLPYCINFNGKLYIPHINIKIVFDPIIIKKILEDDLSYNKIKLHIMYADQKNIPYKLNEFAHNITIFSNKKTLYERIKNLLENHRGDFILEKLTNSEIQENTNKEKNNEIFESIIFTEKEEQELNRLCQQYNKLIEIKKTYDELIFNED